MKEKQVIIGLEIHVQLNTDAKLFCECSTNYSAMEPNMNICPICVGQPGSKPMSPNSKAFSSVLKIAKMLNAKPEIEKEIFVQRKHYFYPDLPSGYQRTSKPIAKDGKLNEIGIWEVHMEEDPGRYELKKGYVDYNRSGVPLVEIVTAPDIKNPAQAKEFLAKLEYYLRYYNLVKDEVGSIRIDANISIEGGARVEVKNINSFSNVHDALVFEIKRQRTQIEQGVKLIQETRHFDEGSGITVRLRKKETADDYRYVPDPDVMPLYISKEDWKKVEGSIEELPDKRAERITNEYKVDPVDAEVLVLEKEFADAFEELVKKFDAQKLANWMRGPLRKQLNYRNLFFRTSGLDTQHIEELYEMFSDGKITDNAMEQILIKMLDMDVLVKSRENNKYIRLKEMPREIAKELQLFKSQDNELLNRACLESIKENPKAVDDYQQGKEKSIFFLVGLVMKKTKGTADAKEIEKTIKELIEAANKH
ncbi:Asp-tRNA(Asn)/Glu-tRNA(Gln) amidotransferase subunit GatB [Candidatus Micrarchaeota archaeon]|nr:Asp-tRNA(Asn)/Glu-tRNA(Gln) amidotransferase subunit GatB [Candidatus Micrarchaeota archaeon]